MRTAGGVRAACLALGLALLGSACLVPPRDAGRNGVRGGTLRVLSADLAVPGLDTARWGPDFVRAYARTLYGHNSRGHSSR
jgi:hypothetical protein